MIIIYPAKDVKKYMEMGPYPHLAVPERCPDCNEAGELVRIGYYSRWVCTETGEHLLRIGRVLCKNCKASHALLPAFLLPRIQSITSVVEKFFRERVLKGKTLKEAMGIASIVEPLRQKGSAWLEGLARKLSEIGHYIATLYPRVDFGEGPRRKGKHLKALYPLLKLLFSGDQEVGQALSWHNFQFYQMTKTSLV